MKKEVIKFYSGKMTLPFGVPFVIVTGWEEKGQLHCERLILFEQFKHPVVKRGLLTNISTADFKQICTLSGEKPTIDNFMEREGKQMAEHDIFSIIADLYKLLKPKTFSGNIYNEISEIKNANWISLLYNYNRKYQSAIDWVYNNTASKALKEKIDFIRKLKITTTDF